MTHEDPIRSPEALAYLYRMPWCILVQGPSSAEVLQEPRGAACQDHFPVVGFSSHTRPETIFSSKSHSPQFLRAAYASWQAFETSRSSASTICVTRAPREAAAVEGL